jgi:hypothetical protein
MQEKVLRLIQDRALIIGDMNSIGARLCCYVFIDTSLTHTLPNGMAAIWCFPNSVVGKLAYFSALLRMVQMKWKLETRYSFVVTLTSLFLFLSSLADTAMRAQDHQSICL